MFGYGSNKCCYNYTKGEKSSDRKKYKTVMLSNPPHMNLHDHSVTFFLYYRSTLIGGAEIAGVDNAGVDNDGVTDSEDKL